MKLHHYKCSNCDYISAHSHNANRHVRLPACRGATVEKDTLYVLAWTRDEALHNAVHSGTAPVTPGLNPAPAHAAMLPFLGPVDTAAVREHVHTHPQILARLLGVRKQEALASTLFRFTKGANAPVHHRNYRVRGNDVLFVEDGEDVSCKPLGRAMPRLVVRLLDALIEALDTAPGDGGGATTRVLEMAERFRDCVDMFDTDREDFDRTKSAALKSSVHQACWLLKTELRRVQQ